MAEITRRALVLTFGTEGSKEVSITIAKPAEDLTATNITSAMDRVIAAKAYGDGDIVNQKLGAKYVVQQVEKITLA